MTTVTTLGIALTVVFALSLAALVAQIAWVLWRRGRFFRNGGDGGGGGVEGDVSGCVLEAPAKATKELLYFICWKNSQASRVEPDGGSGDRPAVEGVSDDGDEAVKWHMMYRESRVLYTIKEEEKEEVVAELDCDRNGSGGLTLTSSAETEEKDEKNKKRRVCLRDCLEEKERESSDFGMEVVLSVLEESLAKTTPFSTPCGSPLYFTPSPSPIRAEQDDANYGKMAALC